MSGYRSRSASMVRHPDAQGDGVIRFEGRRGEVWFYPCKLIVL